MFLLEIWRKCDTAVKLWFGLVCKDKFQLAFLFSSHCEFGYIFPESLRHYYTCCMLTSSILFWDLTIILQNIRNDLISRTVCQKGWYKAHSSLLNTAVAPNLIVSINSILRQLFPDTFLTFSMRFGWFRAISRFFRQVSIIGVNFLQWWDTAWWVLRILSSLLRKV